MTSTSNAKYRLSIVSEDNESSTSFLAVNAATEETEKIPEFIIYDLISMQKGVKKLHHQTQDTYRCAYNRSVLEFDKGQALRLRK